MLGPKKTGNRRKAGGAGSSVAKHCSERRALRVRARSRPLWIIRPSHPASLNSLVNAFGLRRDVAHICGWRCGQERSARLMSAQRRILLPKVQPRSFQNPGVFFKILTKAHRFVFLTQETARAVGAQAVAFIGRDLCGCGNDRHTIPRAYWLAGCRFHILQASPKPREPILHSVESNYNRTDQQTISDHNAPLICKMLEHGPRTKKAFRHFPI